MSAPRGATSRRPSTLPRAPLLALALLLPMTATLALRAGSLADPGEAPLRLSPEQAHSAGLWLDLRQPEGLPAPALALHEPPLSAPDAAPVLMAASPGGVHVAVAERLGQDPTTLVIVEADGSQVRIPFGGLIAAAFAPDGSWLAVSDGLGRLWQVDPIDGTASQLAEGPFTGHIVAEASGSVLALSVPSVEAPFMSHLVRVSPGGVEIPLSEEELVYDVHPLDDGTISIVAHRTSGTVLLRLASGAASPVADLGPGAVNVSVSSDLDVVAWERYGEVSAQRGHGAPVRLGAGANPRVSRGGELILVDVDDGTDAYAPDGRLLARIDDTAVLLDCEGCES